MNPELVDDLKCSRIRKDSGEGAFQVSDVRLGKVEKWRTKVQASGLTV